MSTTVTYKGQTLTTVENQTKTLNTAGTWVEGDFTLTDVTRGGGGDEMYKLIAGTIADSEIDWSKVTNIKEGAFWSCGNITKVGNPAVSNVRSDAFHYCYNMTEAELTLTSQGINYFHSVFSECNKLETATLHFTAKTQWDTEFGGNAPFYRCPKLHTVILTCVNASYPAKSLKLRYTLFRETALLRTLVLKCDNLVIEDMTVNANSFGGIYNNPTDSTIYVPSALISTYQTATNWSTLYNMGVTFAPIEGSIYDD